MTIHPAVEINETLIAVLVLWLDIPGSVGTNSRKMEKRLCESSVLCRKPVVS